MKLATRIEVEGDEGGSWRRGLKLKKATRVEGSRGHLGHVIKQYMEI
jgi:hypothetical protein